MRGQVQESFLSRRILIFGLRQLYWSRVNSYAGAGGNFTNLTNRQIPASAAPVTDINTIGTLIYLPADAQWNTIVSDYTVTQLGWGSDKLLAVSALARQLVQISKHRGEDACYIAGLLVNHLEPTTWLPQLLWHLEDPSIAVRPTAPEYRAPSWSWASLDGRIAMKSNSTVRDKTYYATVDSYHVDLSFVDSPFGALKGANIVLSAHVL
ncbi:hypothetical protein QBC35DRAFT_393762, partial [Podospora australis]